MSVPIVTVYVISPAHFGRVINLSVPAVITVIGHTECPYTILAKAIIRESLLYVLILGGIASVVAVTVPRDFSPISV